MAIDIQKITTFTDFVLEQEHTNSHPSGNLTLLLEQIARAGKIIGSHIRESGLVDILGKTGRLNTFSEEVQRLDQYSNDLLIKTLTHSGQTYALISEEMEEPIYTPKEYQGNYVVYFDPLDGSSNIDTNGPVGTIFSIYEGGETILQPGNKQIAAGYILYGAGIMLVISLGQGVHGFTLDPTIGSFLLSHPNMQIPENGNTYSINEAYSEKYDEKTRQYLKELKGDDSGQARMTSRYIGGMVPDVHRTLVKGGIFLYPADTSHPDGKLRLMLEVNPLSYIIEQAGGKAFAKTGSPLEIVPEHVHERVPIAVGSKKLVEEYISVVRG
jgi:fructose-1,6-bisphosphatase I